MKPIKDDHLVSLINHIALPPKLPQTEERDTPGIEKSLLRLTENVLSEYDNRSSAAWKAVSKMLRQSSGVRSGSGLDAEQLDTALLNMELDGKLTYETK
jgi:hypothetical protein